MMTTADITQMAAINAMVASERIHEARTTLLQLTEAIKCHDGAGNNLDSILATITRTVEALSLRVPMTSSQETRQVPMELLVKILRECDQQQMLSLRLVNSSWNRAVLYVLRDIETPTLSFSRYKKLRNYILQTGGLNSLKIKFNPEQEEALLLLLRMEEFKLHELHLSLYWSLGEEAFKTKKFWFFHFKGLQKVTIRMYIRNTGIGIDKLLADMDKIESFTLEVIDFIGDYPVQYAAKQLILPLKELTLSVYKLKPEGRSNTQCRMLMETISKHKFPKLESLELDGCEVNYGMLKKLVVPTLKRLTIQKMEMTTLTEVLNALEYNSVELTQFTFASNSFKPDENLDLDNRKLSPLRELHELCLWSTRISSTGLSNILRVTPHLRVLELVHNPEIEFISDAEADDALTFGHIIQWCRHMRRLDLHWMGLSDLELYWLCEALKGQKQRLQMLDIGGNQYSDLALERFLENCGTHLRDLTVDTEHPEEIRSLAMRSGVYCRLTVCDD